MTKWFVRRESDNRMLCVDGKWRNMVSADRIKLYSSVGRANRYGLAGQPDVPIVADGSLTTRGTVYAVYEGESIGADGKIYDVEGNLRKIT